MIVYAFEHTDSIMILLCILLPRLMQNTGQPILKQIHNINSSYLHVMCINERVEKFVSLVRNRMKWICVCLGSSLVSSRRCSLLFILFLFTFRKYMDDLMLFCFGIRNAATAGWIGILNPYNYIEQTTILYIIFVCNTYNE
jgi:hypothetical protein